METLLTTLREQGQRQEQLAQEQATRFGQQLEQLVQNQTTQFGRQLEQLTQEQRERNDRFSEQFTEHRAAGATCAEPKTNVRAAG